MSESTNEQLVAELRVAHASLSEYERREAEIRRKEAFWEDQKRTERWLSAQMETLTSVIKGFLTAVEGQWPLPENIPPDLKKAVGQVQASLSSEGVLFFIKNRARASVYAAALVELVQNLHRELLYAVPRHKVHPKTHQFIDHPYLNEVVPTAQDILKLLVETLDYKPGSDAQVEEVHSKVLSLTVKKEADHFSVNDAEQS